MEWGGVSWAVFGKRMWMAAGTLWLPSGLAARDGPGCAPCGEEARARRREAGIRVNSELLEDSPRPCLEPRITVRDTQSGTT